MKGIVYDTATGAVKYKFETPDLPVLQPGESIKQRTDIDLIQVGATYNSGNNSYVNPVPGLTPKQQYAALPTDVARIAYIASFLGLV